MIGAASPYASTTFTVRRISSMRAVYGSPLCRPPSSNTVGRVIPRSATIVDATFVDLESLIQSTPLTSATFSMRCSRPWKVRSPRETAPSAFGVRCASLARTTASADASALATLWSPMSRRSLRDKSGSPRTSSMPRE